MDSTVRIDLGGGAWAIVRREVLHRTFVLHEELLRKAMTPVGDTKVKMSDIEAGKKMPKIDYVLDTALVDTNEVNKIYILNQVESWSIGPINEETIHSVLTRDQCLRLVKEMDRLYQPTPFLSSAKAATGLAKRFTAPFR